MTRATFADGFAERQRFVLQQHDRANLARATRDMIVAQLSARGGQPTPFLEHKRNEACAAVVTAEIGEDAAIDEFARYVYDAIQRGGAHEVAHPDTATDGQLLTVPSPDVAMTSDRVGEREPLPDADSLRPGGASAETVGDTADRRREPSTGTTE